MTRVQALQNAARSATSKFHQLRLRYWNRAIDHVACVEGNEDLEYYIPVLRKHLGSNVALEGFVAAGKSNVLECFARAKRNRWNVARISFFVDSDLESLVTPVTPVAPNLYKTDFYSIESECVSARFFDAVWVDLFHLSITDARMVVWRAQYERAHRAVAEKLIVLFAAAVACKRAKGNVDFDALDVEKIFKIDATGNVALKAVKPTKKPMIDLSVTIGYRTLAALVLELRGCDFRVWFRGKYALSVSMNFMKVMKATLGAKGVVPRAVVKYQFSTENGVGCIASRSIVPATLQVFLDGLSARIAADRTSP